MVNSTSESVKTLQNGHHAEAAALGAALALHAAGYLDRAHFETLVRPMAEALPWLLTVPGANL